MSIFSANQYYGQYSIEDIVCHNLINFLRQGFLELGAYTNISVSGATQSQSQLQPVIVPYVTGYTLYKGIKGDWIWEQDFTLKTSGTMPFRVNGIYHNNTFYPTGSSINGTGFYVDYSNGYVVFDKPLASGDQVKCNYSVRRVSVYNRDSYQYLDLNLHWQNMQASSGVKEINPQGYLPCVFVCVKDYRTIKGTELGNLGKTVEFNLQFDVFSQNAFDRKQIQDSIYMLEGHHIQLYDLRVSPNALNFQGQLVSGTLNYSNLVSGYPLGNARFMEKGTVKKNDSLLPLHSCTVKIPLEFDIYPV